MSSRGLKRAMMNIALASAIMSMGNPESSIGLSQYEPTRCKSPEEIPGYAHKGKSEHRLEERRLRRKKFKAKRNAKKGIYVRTIKYKKDRSK